MRAWGSGPTPPKHCRRWLLPPPPPLAAHRMLLFSLPLHRESVLLVSKQFQRLFFETPEPWRYITVDVDPEVDGSLERAESMFQLQLHVGQHVRQFVYCHEHIVWDPQWTGGRFADLPLGLTRLECHGGDSQQPVTVLLRRLTMLQQLAMYQLQSACSELICQAARLSSLTKLELGLLGEQQGLGHLTRLPQLQQLVLCQIDGEARPPALTQLRSLWLAHMYTEDVGYIWVRCGRMLLLAVCFVYFSCSFMLSWQVHLPYAPSTDCGCHYPVAPVAGGRGAAGVRHFCRGVPSRHADRPSVAN